MRLGAEWQETDKCHPRVRTRGTVLLPVSWWPSLALMEICMGDGVPSQPQLLAWGGTGFWVYISFLFTLLPFPFSCSLVQLVCTF